jgi:Predicted phosphohydrolases
VLRRQGFLLSLLALAPIALAGCPAPGTGSTSGSPSPAASPAQTAAPAALPALEKVATPQDTFFTLPYLQLGTGARGTLELLWHVKEASADGWAVELRTPGKPAWRKSGQPLASRRVAVGGVPAHTVVRAVLDGLEPGLNFDYRVLKGGKPVFTARALAPKTADGSDDGAFRFVAFGDCAEGTPGQKRVAHQTFLAKPDFVLVTGDIVYDRGRASEYRSRFFPIYNADTAEPKIGAPLLRSTLFVGISGNHDLTYANLGRWPDGLAYYYYWSQPLNGPALTPGGRFTPPVRGSEGAKAALAKASGEAYPRGATFSFDYGNAHFTVLDSNYYMDWTNPELRAWLEKDLAGAQNAAWRFVGLHVPPFHSSRKHQEEQWMRVLSDLFEKYRVDLVISGHVHNYQRTFPMQFQAIRGLDGNFVGRGGRVAGEWALDREFDGETRTRPNGVIYLVTGAGGGALYDRGQQKDEASHQPFTAKYVADTHSFTVFDVKGRTLTVRQIDATGKERDRFTVAK